MIETETGYVLSSAIYRPVPRGRNGNVKMVSAERSPGMALEGASGTGECLFQLEMMGMEGQPGRTYIKRRRARIISCVPVARPLAAWCLKHTKEICDLAKAEYLGREHHMELIRMIGPQGSLAEKTARQDQIFKGLMEGKKVRALRKLRSVDLAFHAGLRAAHGELLGYNARVLYTNACMAHAYAKGFEHSSAFNRELGATSRRLQEDFSRMLAA